MPVVRLMIALKLASLAARRLRGAAAKRCALVESYAAERPHAGDSVARIGRRSGDLAPLAHLAGTLSASARCAAAASGCRRRRRCGRRARAD